MTLMPLSAWNIAVVVIGYLLSLVGGRIIIENIIGRLWKEYIPPEYARQPKLVAYVGFIESFLYTSATLVGRPEFITVWLAIKLAGQWSPTKTDIDRPLFHLFLIGNGLNVIISVGAAFFIQQLIQH
jgi:hypothetical protein